MNATPMHSRLRAWPGLLLILAVLLGASWAPQPASAAPSPSSLEFNADAGGIDQTGFDSVLAGANAANNDLTSVAGGALVIQATGGDLPPYGSGQDSALALSYTSSGSYTIGARLLKSSFAGSFKSAGIFVGKSSSQYIRFSASRSGTNERLQLDVVDSNGKLRATSIPLPAGTFAGIQTSLDLFLTIDHQAKRISALYRIDSDLADAGRQATSRNFPRWLRQGNNVPVFAGVAANSSLATPTPVSYDWFRLTLAPQVVAVVTGVKTVDRDGTTSAVTPGDTLTYTISVSNNGAATSAQVSDPIPADTTYLAGSATSGATYDQANDRIVWQSAALGAGSTLTFSFKVTINNTALQSATIANTASLTSGGSAIPSLLGATTAVSGVPDLSSSNFAVTPTVVGPNGTQSYLLTLFNDGTVGANNPAATLLVPVGTILQPNSASASGGTLAIDPSLTQLTWSSASPLAASGTVTIAFSTKPSASLLNGTPIVATAAIQADGTLPTLLTAQSAYSTTSNFSASKSVDKALANPGETLTYTLSIANTGPQMNNIVVSDTLSQDTIYLGNVKVTPGAPQPSFSAGTLTWPIPALSASTTITASFQAQIKPLPLHSGTIVNRALLRATGAPNTLMSAATQVRGLASLDSSLYRAAPAAIGLGGTVTYTLSLINDGNGPAGGASATLKVPAGMALVANSGQASSGSLVVNTALTQLSWAAGAPLPVGAVVRVSFRARLVTLQPNPRYISSANMQASGLLPYAATAFSLYSAQAPSKLEMYLPVIRN